MFGSGSATAVALAHKLFPFRVNNDWQYVSESDCSVVLDKQEKGICILSGMSENSQFLSVWLRKKNSWKEQLFEIQPT
jgi:hypothetical protein